MSYKVVKAFADLQDDKHIYNVGDTFPHNGVEVSKDRLKELSSSDNKQGVPLIEKVSSPKDNASVVEEEKPKTKTTRKKRSDNAD